MINPAPAPYSQVSWLLPCCLALAAYEVSLLVHIVPYCTSFHTSSDHSCGSPDSSPLAIRDQLAGPYIAWLSQWIRLLIHQIGSPPATARTQHRRDGSTTPPAGLANAASPDACNRRDQQVKLPLKAAQTRDANAPTHISILRPLVQYIKRSFSFARSNGANELV